MQTVVDAITGGGGGPGTLTLLDEKANATEALAWHEVHDLARRMSGVLGRYGVGPGSHVGLAGRTSTTIALALQSIWLSGGCLTVLPPAEDGSSRTRKENARRIAADAGLTAVLATDGADDLESAMPGTRVLRLEKLLAEAKASPAAPVHHPASSDLAVLQYTSGSTRTPQGVPVTHGHLMSNVEGIRASLKHDEWHPGQWLSWLPLYHDLGLIAFFILPMSCGCPLAISPPEAFVRNPIGWLTGMSKYRAIISGAPNFAYGLLSRLLATGRFSEGIDLSGMRFLVSGGEPIDAEMMAKFACAATSLGLDERALLPAYGLAEATLAASMTPADAGLRTDLVDPVLLESSGIAQPGTGRKLVSAGFAVPGVDIRITDRATGLETGPRRVGHIELRGSSVIGRYWGEPELPHGTWMRTGDLGYLTAEGELIVCGRHKDVVFAAGRNIFPQDVEAAAQEAPGVRPGGAAAFGLTDDSGDRLVVAVESRNSDPAEVKRQVSERIRAEVGLTPKDVVVVSYGQLPKTTSGKLRRAETRRKYLAGEFAGRQTR